MIVTLGWLALCYLLTVVAWMAALFWPLPPSQGAYDFGNVFTAYPRLAAVIIFTLVVWLVYFALLRGHS